MNALLQRCLFKGLDSSGDRGSASCLIICDDVNQFFDEAIQDVGMVNIVEELHQPMLFSKRLKFCNDFGQLPVNNDVIRGASVFFEGGGANVLSTSLRVFSSLSRSSTGYVSIPPSD